MASSDASGTDDCRDILRPNVSDRRIRRTIASLHEAVLDLLPEKPFEMITVQDIADRADVSRAAFYTHFPDKFALMEHIVANVYDRTLSRSAGKAGAHSTEATIRRTFHATCVYLSEIFSQCRHARRLLDPLIQARVSERIRRDLDRVLLQAAIAGEGEQADADLTATVLSWSIYGAALGWANDSRQQPSEEFVEQSFAVVCSSYLNWRRHG